MFPVPINLLGTYVLSDGSEMDVKICRTRIISHMEEST